MQIVKKPKGYCKAKKENINVSKLLLNLSSAIIAKEKLIYFMT
jgi:hypothetical protein